MHARRAVIVAIAQHRITDARHLVGERAGGAVVMGSALHVNGPRAQRVERAAALLRYGGRAQHTTRACVSSMRK